MKKVISIALAVLIVFFFASAGLAAEDSLTAVQQEVNQTNDQLHELIETAKEEARDIHDTYLSGEIQESAYRTGITSIAKRLIQETQELVNETRLFAVSHGVRVKCYRVMVDLAFIKISIDPLIVCDD